MPLIVGHRKKRCKSSSCNFCELLLLQKLHGDTCVDQFPALSVVGVALYRIMYVTSLAFIVMCLLCMFEGEGAWLVM